jgi:hypothetical protein
MKLGDQACSYEQAVKLRELGVELNPYFSYYTTGESKSVQFTESCFTLLNRFGWKKRLSTYTASELMEMLPVNIKDYSFTITKSANTDKKYYCGYYNQHRDDHLIDFYNNSVSCALGDLAIWLLENNYINIKEINGRH